MNLRPLCGCPGRGAFWCWLDSAVHALPFRRRRATGPVAWICDRHDRHITGDASAFRRAAQSRSLWNRPS